MFRKGFFITLLSIFFVACSAPNTATVPTNSPVVSTVTATAASVPTVAELPQGLPASTSAAVPELPQGASVTPSANVTEIGPQPTTSAVAAQGQLYCDQPYILGTNPHKVMMYRNALLQGDLYDLPANSSFCIVSHESAQSNTYLIVLPTAHGLAYVWISDVDMKYPNATVAPAVDAYFIGNGTPIVTTAEPGVSGLSCDDGVTVLLPTVPTDAVITVVSVKQGSLLNVNVQVTGQSAQDMCMSWQALKFTENQFFKLDFDFLRAALQH